MMRSSVVLPEPDGPSSARNWPVGTVRLIAAQRLKRAERAGRVANLDAHAV